MHALPTPAILAVNHLLKSAAWARQKLAPFAGHTAKISMPPFVAAFLILEDGYIAAPTPGDETTPEPEVSITLPATAPLLALQGNDKVMRAARLEGSADFAEALGFVIRNLRWDVEEDLSKVVGDIAAHRIVDGTQKFVVWHQKAAQNLAENLAEYFTEEQPLIARRLAITDFSSDIDRLRDDVARLEKRVQRLA
jgi:ubiquinone biosynthesis protein UbiJ